jgi:hypothetical protein
MPPATTIAMPVAVPIVKSGAKSAITLTGAFIVKLCGAGVRSSHY